MSKFILSLVFLTICSTAVNSQIMFKTSYYSSSDYLDKDHNKVGDSKGSAIVYQGGVNLPVSVKIDKYNKPIMWGIGLGGAFASLENKNFTEDLVLSEILNLQMGLMHMRNISDKWSMLASVGVGIYSPNTQFSNITFENVMGNLGVIFIRQLKPNLSVGGGVAINNTFGYPMIFPSLYFDWSYSK